MAERRLNLINTVLLAFDSSVELYVRLLEEAT
jgi:hypothetical protein